jgi:hypothetical protein
MFLFFVTFLRKKVTKKPSSDDEARRPKTPPAGRAGIYSPFSGSSLLPRRCIVNAASHMYCTIPRSK